MLTEFLEILKVVKLHPQTKGYTLLLILSGGCTRVTVFGNISY